MTFGLGEVHPLFCLNGIIPNDTFQLKHNGDEEEYFISLFQFVFNATEKGLPS